MISEIGDGALSPHSFRHTILDKLLKVSIYYEETISEILTETPEWTSFFSRIRGMMRI